MTTTSPTPVTGATAPASRRERMAAPAWTIGGLAAVTLALHLRDPHDGGSWGYCPSAAMGIYCPGCGGLRAVNDLTNGHVGAAASSNLLFIVMAPFVVFLLGRWALDSWTGRVRRSDPRLVRAGWVTLSVLAVAFTILRNIPAGSWLAP